MRFSENRTIAFVVLAVCVLVSVFGFGGMGLAKERNRVLAVYDRGSDTSLPTRHSVDAYLDSAAENAALMASEASLLKSSSPAVESVAQLAESLASEGDTNARFEALEALKTAADKLYNDLIGSVSEADFKNFRKAYDDFREKVNMIRYDDYPKLAASYNALIGGFPAGLVAGITGQGALSTFGG